MSSFGVSLKPVPEPPKPGLLFSTDNSVMTLNGPGVCVAMIADWIKKCKKKRGLVEVREELDPSNMLAISQSAGEGGRNGNRKIMNNAGIDLVQSETFLAPPPPPPRPVTHLPQRPNIPHPTRTVIPQPTPLHEYVDVSRVATTLAITDGFCYLSIGFQLDGRDMFHAIGTYVHEQDFEFFDPNKGLIRFQKIEFFRGSAMNVLGGYHPEIVVLWKLGGL